MQAQSSQPSLYTNSISQYQPVTQQKLNGSSKLYHERIHSKQYIEQQSSNKNTSYLVDLEQYEEVQGINETKQCASEEEDEELQNKEGREVIGIREELREQNEEEQEEEQEGEQGEEQQGKQQGEEQGEDEQNEEMGSIQEQQQDLENSNVIKYQENQETSALLKQTGQNRFQQDQQQKYYELNQQRQQQSESVNNQSRVNANFQQDSQDQQYQQKYKCQDESQMSHSQHTNIEKQQEKQGQCQLQQQQEQKQEQEQEQEQEEQQQYQFEQGSRQEDYQPSQENEKQIQGNWKQNYQSRSLQQDNTEQLRQSNKQIKCESPEKHEQQEHQNQDLEQKNIDEQSQQQKQQINKQSQVINQNIPPTVLEAQTMPEQSLTQTLPISSSPPHIPSISSPKNSSLTLSSLSKILKFLHNTQSKSYQSHRRHLSTFSQKLSHKILKLSSKLSTLQIAYQQYYNMYQLSEQDNQNDDGKNKIMMRRELEIMKKFQPQCLYRNCEEEPEEGCLKVISERTLENATEVEILSQKNESQKNKSVKNSEKQDKSDHNVKQVCQVQQNTIQQVYEGKQKISKKCRTRSSQQSPISKPAQQGIQSDSKINEERTVKNFSKNKISGQIGLIQELCHQKNSSQISSQTESPTQSQILQQIQICLQSLPQSQKYQLLNICQDLLFQNPLTSLTQKFQSILKSSLLSFFQKLEYYLTSINLQAFVYKIDSLINKIQEQEENRIRLERVVEERDARIEDIQKQMKSMKAAMEELEQENREFCEMCEKGKNQVIEQRSISDNLRDEIKQLNTQNQQLTSDKHQLQIRITSLQSQLTTLTQILARSKQAELKSQKHICQLQQTIIMKNQQERQLSAEIDKLKEKCKQLDSPKGNKKGEQKGREMENSTRMDVNKKYEEEIAKKEEQIRKLVWDCKQLQKNCEDLKSMNGILRKDLLKVKQIDSYDWHKQAHHIGSRKVGNIAKVYSKLKQQQPKYKQYRNLTSATSPSQSLQFITPLSQLSYYQKQNLQKFKTKHIHTNVPTHAHTHINTLINKNPRNSTLVDSHVSVGNAGSYRRSTSKSKQLEQSFINLNRIQVRYNEILRKKYMI